MHYDNYSTPPPPPPPHTYNYTLTPPPLPRQHSLCVGRGQFQRSSQVLWSQQVGQLHPHEPLACTGSGDTSAHVWNCTVSIPRQRNSAAMEKLVCWWWGCLMTCRYDYPLPNPIANDCFVMQVCVPVHVATLYQMHGMHAGMIYTSMHKSQFLAFYFQSICRSMIHRVRIAVCLMMNWSHLSLSRPPQLPW